ncbi:hypothetical protein [Streptomyces sp. NPDC007346]|uniref:hypothetical protein n=1 Tax=Streptomyces sp. NPDC007346 TaxID=3154682 RepID=UPI0034517743
MTTPPTPDAALPPFSGDNPLCGKCSHVDAYTDYRAAGEYSSNERPRSAPSPKGERLERTCGRCGFIWDEALVPPGELIDSPLPDTAVTVAELAEALQESHAGWPLGLSPACAEAAAEQLLDRLRVYHRTGTPASPATTLTDQKATS